MPIIDHVAKAVAANSNGVTIPYAYNPGALNRYMVIVAMACHPTNTLVVNPFQSAATYAGADFDQVRTARSLGESGEATAWCVAFARSLLLGEQSLSGDVVVPVASAQNIVAYAIGFRGVGSFPYVWESANSNHSSTATIVSVLDNPYLALTALAIKSEATVASVSGAAEILEQEVISDGVGSITGALVMAPTGQNLTTCFLSGNAGVGRVGWVPLADMDQGVDILPAPPPPLAREPLSPYVRHELYWRGGIGKPL